MPAESCGKGAITLKMLHNATEVIVNKGFEPYERIVSPKAYRLLKKIRAKLPGWDNWSIETEILWKAYTMGLIDHD